MQKEKPIFNFFASMGELIVFGKQRGQASSDIQEDTMRASIQGVFLNRGQGLTKFLRSYFRPADEHIPMIERKLAIVGSSLKGLIGYANLDGDLVQETEPQRSFRDNLEQALRHGWAVRIAMTHPDFGELRSLAEGRYPGDIRNEIIGNLKYLVSKFSTYIKEVGNEVREPEEEKENQRGTMEIALYPSSPTMFVLATPRAMLINPYFYGRTAMENVCMEILPASPPGGISLYNLIRSSHIEELWASSSTIRIKSEEDIHNVLSSSPSYPRNLNIVDIREAARLYGRHISDIQSLIRSGILHQFIDRREIEKLMKGT